MDSETTLVTSTPKQDDVKKQKGTFKSPFKSPFASTRKCIQNTPTSGEMGQKKPVTFEDRKLSKESRLLYCELQKQINTYTKEINNLKQVIKILKNDKTEARNLKLIEKWRNITQGGMSYLLNSTLFKIDKLGGYEEFIKKEIEAEKRKIEYQMDNGIQDQIDDVLESEEFQRLPLDVQEEYKSKMDEKINEMETSKTKLFESLENKLGESKNNEMTMEELSKRLRIDYDLVFPE